MSVPSRRMGLRRLVECAVLIAIGTVLSLFEFSGPWALGGGITVCSMLPLVLICHRHGTKWGISSALVYGVLQMPPAVSRRASSSSSDSSVAFSSGRKQSALRPTRMAFSALTRSFCCMTTSKILTWLPRAADRCGRRQELRIFPKKV